MRKPASEVKRGGGISRSILKGGGKKKKELKKKHQLFCDSTRGWGNKTSTVKSSEGYIHKTRGSRPLLCQEGS